jgi:hypothetical protein
MDNAKQHEAHRNLYDMVHTKANRTNVNRDDRRAAARRAPYISFASVLRVLEALRTSWPHVKDTRQFIEDLNKPRATHRIGALRFLGLLDSENVPTPALAGVLSAIGTAAWPDSLALTIRHAFQPIFDLDLASVTLTQFSTAFAQHYAGSEAVQRKSRTFFVHAAIQARIPLSPGLVRAAKPRAGDRAVVASRSKRRLIAVRGSNHPAWPAAGGTVLDQSPSLAVRLLSELDTHAMDDDVRQAFWTLLRHIKDRGP